MQTMKQFKVFFFLIENFKEFKWQQLNVGGI